MFSERYNLIHLESVNSTNLHASALLSEKKINSACIIVSDFQTSGRGQGSNSWKSDPGMNLLLSLVVFPSNFKADEQFYLSKATSISVRELVAKKAGSPQIKIKWPNDVLSGNKKIAGILIENTIEGNDIRHSIIGVGINVNQIIFPEFPIRATSIKNIILKETSLHLLLEEFTNIFDYWYDHLEDRDFNQIDTCYYRYLFGFQKTLTYNCGGTTFNARIVDVEKSGRLVLQMSDRKIRKFGFKEVDFVIN